jgi:tRNA-specific 2-thiouridylase
VLARLTGDELARLRFPLGELDKPRVRELAATAGLPVARKPESQDLCFLAGTASPDFMRRHAAEQVAAAERGGEIVDRSGTVLGRHGGHHRFTVGQRRGIGVAAAEPLFVLSKDAGRNRVVVGPRAELATTAVGLAPGVLHRPGARARSVRLRYHSPSIPCSLPSAPGAGRHESVDVTLQREVAAAAPGQTACLMDGDMVVGWGTVQDQAGPARG